MLLCCSLCLWLDYPKRWMFATSFAISVLWHVSASRGGRRTIHVAGRQLEDGTYLSPGTAEYPASLASAFIQLVVIGVMSHTADLSPPSQWTRF